MLIGIISTIRKDDALNMKKEQRATMLEDIIAK